MARADTDTLTLGSEGGNDREATPLVEDARATIEHARVLATGACLGRYVVVGVLGSGGMGEVYRARDPKLDRDVAIKVLRAELAPGARAQARLEREAQAMARLAHPNVAAIYDVGAVGAHVYLAMELVEGGTLRARHAARPPWRAVVEDYVQAARGLAAAHAAGLVHRDFKPENVLVGLDGRVRVVDFGLVRVDAEDSPAGAPRALHGFETSRSTLVGTPAYMAPEAASGDRVDARADQYSFCVALYQALYGALPTRGALVRVPATPRIPRPLARAIERGLAARPADRHPSMAALADVLARAVAPRGRAFVLRTRRRSSRLLLGVLAGALIASGAITAWVVTGRDDAPAPSPAVTHFESLARHQVTFGSDTRVLGLSPDGRTLAYATADRLVLLDLASKTELEVAALRDTSIEGVRWFADSSALFASGTSAGTFVIQRGDGSLKPHATGPWPVYSVTGESARAPATAKAITIARDERVTKSIPIDGNYLWLNTLGWSPDGRYVLLSTVADEITTFSKVDTSGTRITIGVEPARTYAAQFTPDGSAILYLRSQRYSTHNDEYELVYMPLHGKSRVLIDRLPTDVISLSRSGNRLVFARPQQPTELWFVDVRDADSEQPVVQANRILADTSTKSDPQPSPDGRSVSYTGTDAPSSSVFVVASGGGAPQLIGGGSQDHWSAVWSPDGSQLAYVSRSGDQQVQLWVANRDGTVPHAIVAPRLTGDDRLGWEPASTISYPMETTDDGRNVGMVDPRTARSRAWRDVARGWLFTPRPSPDGRWVASRWNQGIVRGGEALWLFATDGQPARQIGSTDVHLLAWSSDSSSLYWAREGAFTKLSRLSIATGESRPWIRLPIERIADCGVATGGASIACVAGGGADVWVIDDFDRILPRP